MKKLFSIILIALFAVTATFVGVSLSSLDNGNSTPSQEGSSYVDAKWSGSGTSSSPYLIATTSDLQTLATNVNSGTTYSGKYFKLTASLDFSSVSSYAPIGGGIGRSGTSRYFSGIFDGDYKIISNVSMSASSSYNYDYGLFGYTYGATIKNLTVENITISQYNETTYLENAGGIVGRAVSGTTIENCLVTGTISAYYYVGGVVGYADSISMENCFSKATVTSGSSRAGGIMGYSLNCYDISSCANFGAVTATDGDYVGGIVGEARGTGFYDCYNTGTITGGSYVGGIVGYGYSSYDDVNRSYNTGAIHADDSAGGMIGYSAGMGVSEVWSYCYMYITDLSNINDGLIGEYTSSGYGGGTYWYDRSGNLDSSYDMYGDCYLSNLGTLAKTAAFYEDDLYWWFSTTDCSDVWYLDPNASQFPILSSALWWSGVGGVGSASSPFQIKNEDDIRNLSLRTNMGLSSRGINFAQTADITLTKAHTPIGLSGTYFYSNYDGKGYSISGLTVSRSASYNGLFGYTYYSTLKNIILFAPSITASSSSYSGALAGYVYYGSVSWCTAYSPSIAGYTYAGGLIGYASYTSSITECNVYSLKMTNAYDYSGGLVGQLNYVNKLSYCTVSGSIAGRSGGYWIGGIVGRATNSSTTKRSITYCHNKATMTANGAYWGGIIGYSQGYQIQYCVNGGAITSSTNYTGGIAGYFTGYNSSNFAKINYCYNTGTISGTGYVGGLIGNMYYYSYLEDSYNAGSVTGSGTYIGGLVGYISAYTSSSYKNKIYWSYNRGVVKSNCTSSSTGYVGGLVGYIGSGYSELWANFNVGAVSSTGTNTCYVGAITGGYTTSYSQSISANFFDSNLYADGLTASDGSNTYSREMDHIDCELYDDYYYWSIVSSESAAGSSTWMFAGSHNGGYPVLRELYANYYDGDGTSSDPYIIRSVSNLQALQWNVNLGNTYSGKYFKQAVNLDLSSITNWTPIGNESYNSRFFAANYDGNGYSVSGVKINAAADFQGLFGYTSNATIKNLSLLSFDIKNTKSNTGGLAGDSSYYVEISYCNIKNSTIKSSGNYVGGLVGEATMMNNCYNSSTSVSGVQYVGGITGYFSGSSTSNKIYGCYNTGNVTSLGGYYTGGIVGYASSTYSYSSHISVQECYNTGTVTSSSYYTGGIVGETYYYVNVLNCFNKGNVSGSNTVGGIVGRQNNYSTSTESYRGRIENCYNTGTVSGTSSSNAYAGGIVGYIGSYGVLKYNYNAGTISSTSSHRGGIGGYVNTSYLTATYFVTNYYYSVGATQGWGNTTSTIGVSSTNSNGGSSVGSFAQQNSWYNNQVWFYNTAINGGFPMLKTFYFADGSGWGTSSNPFTVSSVAQLQIISKNSNFYEHGYQGIHIFQLNGIELTGIWEPIASFRSNTDPFRGTYNGDQCGIDGLRLHPATNCPYQGLFGYTEGATLQSVWFENGVDAGSDVGGYVGALVGYAVNTTITDCYIIGVDISACNDYAGGIVGYLECSTIMTSSVESSSIYCEGENVGGLVGYADTSTISDSSFYTGTVEGCADNVGGIVGSADGGSLTNLMVDDVTIGSNDSALNIGGIVGIASSTQIHQCSVRNGSIGAYGTNVGGIAGKVEWDCYVSECINTSDVGGTDYVGGIVGNMWVGNTIENCYNAGEVYADRNCAGGIVGWAGSQGEGNSDVIMTSYNKGTVSAYEYAGGILGELYDYVDVMYSYNIASIDAMGYIGGVVGSIDYSDLVTITENYYEWDTAQYGIGSPSSDNGAIMEQLCQTDLAMGENWSLYEDWWDFYEVWRIFPSGTVTMANGGTFQSNGFPMLLWELPKLNQTLNANGGTGNVSVGWDNYTTYVTAANTYIRPGFTPNGWNKSSVITETPAISNTAEFRLGENILYANWNPLQLTINVSITAYADLSKSTVLSYGVPDGASLKITGYSMRYSGVDNNTQHASYSISSNGAMTQFRQWQTLTFNIDVGDEWIVTGTITRTSNSTSQAVQGSGKFEFTFATDATTGLNLELAFIKAGPVLKYDHVDKYFYFEDGMFPQTAVVTYSTSFNTLLTNVYSSSTGTSFVSNGITFMTQTYTYASGQDSAFEAYSGQSFLGFAMPSARTIKFKNDGNASRTFDANTTYWFLYEPIRWRVTDYGVSETDLPPNWDTWLETKENQVLASDVLWYDRIDDSLYDAETALDTDLFKLISSNSFMGGVHIGEYATENWSSGYSMWNKFQYGYTSGNYKEYTFGPLGSKVAFADVNYEISQYQDDLRCYASQLVAVLANKNQTEYFEYWARDFGQQMGCGTYVTKSGVVLKNSYWNTMKGVRLSTRLTTTTYAGNYSQNLYSFASLQTTQSPTVDKTNNILTYSYMNSGTATNYANFFNPTTPQDFDPNGRYLYVLDVTDFYSSTGSLTVHLGNTHSTTLSLLSYKSFNITGTGTYSYIATGVNKSSYSLFSRDFFSISAGQEMRITFKVGLYKLD